MLSGNLVIDAPTATHNSQTADLIDEPRHFSVDELFFSTTDLKGRILKGNSVFRRISGYSWDELKNKPHNIIRHPDVPRIVFKALWDTIQAGRPIVAYVKNLAKDRRYYWVVAMVVPISDGYLSVRFKPTSPLFATVKGLYTELRAAEASIEIETKDKKAAMAASGQMLTATLEKLGFSSYEDFMQEMLKQELQSRETHLRNFTHSTDASDSLMAPDQSSEIAPVRTAAQLFDALLEVLRALFHDLESYVSVNKGVREKSENVTETAESLRVLALNGAIEADRLGANAVGLRPVLDWLRSFSAGITKEVARLTASLVELTRDVDRVVFDLSAAKLQIEMTALFAHELVELAVRSGSTEVDQGMQGAIDCLYNSSHETVSRALSNLAAIKNRLKGLTESQAKLLESSHFLRPLYLKGKVEMADGAGPKLEVVFSDARGHLDETVLNLRGLKSLLGELETLLIRGLDYGKRIDEINSQIESVLPSIA